MIIITTSSFLRSALFFIGLTIAVSGQVQSQETEQFRDTPIQVRELQPPVSQSTPTKNNYIDMLEEWGSEKADATSPTKAMPQQVPVVPKPKVREQTGFFTHPQRNTLRALRSAKILRMDIEPGKVYKQAETVITLDCLALAAKIEEVRLQHEQAKIRRQHAMLKRQEDKITRQEFSLTELDAEILLARLNRLRKEKEACMVQMPYSGRIQKVYVREGENVQSADPLADIVPDGPLHFVVEIPVSWMKSIAVGQELTVYIEALDLNNRVKVTRIDDEVHLTSQTISIMAQVISGQPLLRSGMQGVLRKPETGEQ